MLPQRDNRPIEPYDARAQQLIDRVRRCVREWDPQSAVRVNPAHGAAIDLTIVSQRFANLRSDDRDALFWPALDPIPDTSLSALTRCLLVTPEEADRVFNPSIQAPDHPAENWDDGQD